LELNPKLQQSTSCKVTGSHVPTDILTKPNLINKSTNHNAKLDNKFTKYTKTTADYTQMAPNGTIRHRPPVTGT